MKTPGSLSIVVHSIAPRSACDLAAREGESDDAPTNYFEYGPQNSRGFRALKVWLSLKQAGQEGFSRMIGDDLALFWLDCFCFGNHGASLQNGHKMIMFVRQTLMKKDTSIQYVQFCYY